MSHNKTEKREREGGKRKEEKNVERQPVNERTRVQQGKTIIFIMIIIFVAPVHTHTHPTSTLIPLLL